MADQVAGVLRHARAAFLVSVLLFSVIVYHHSSMQTGYSEGAPLHLSKEARGCLLRKAVIVLLCVTRCTRHWLPAHLNLPALYRARGGA